METKIKEIIRKEFDTETIDIKRIKEGYSHFMYLIKINKSPFDLIIRFSNNKNEVYGLGKEKYIIDTLKNINVPVPKIYSYHEDYMILEKMPGIRLDTIWNVLSKKEKIQITQELGKLLKKIHTIKFKSFGYIKENGNIKSDLEGSFKFKGALVDLKFNPFLREIFVAFGKDFSRLLAYNILTLDFVCHIQKYIYSNINKLDYKGKPVLCHGDYHQGHIFVEKINDKYKIVGLIDFEFAISYPPEYDFLKLHRAGLFDDPELKQALIKGYGNIDEKSVEIHRLLRDIGFSQVILDADDKKTSYDTLIKIAKNINYTGEIFKNI